MRLSNEVTKIKSYIAPILAALQQIDDHLEQKKQLTVLVAARCKSELKQRNWPSHNEVVPTLPPKRRVRARMSRSALATKSVYQAVGQPTLCFVLRGRAILKFTDYILPLRAGDCVFVPQGVPQEIGSHTSGESPKEECTLLWLRPHLSEQWFHAWICHSHGLEHESGPEWGTCRVENAVLNRQFQNLSHELQNDNEPKIVCRFVLGLLALLQREINLGRAYLPGHHLADQHAPISSDLQNPMELACSFIDEYLSQSLVESRVARHVCISPTLFRQRFHQHTGMTFHSFLTIRRLEKANTLLHDTDIAVADISRLVGLHYSQFRRLYYRYYNCSPGEFRKQVRLNKMMNKDI